MINRGEHHKQIRLFEEFLTLLRELIREAVIKRYGDKYIIPEPKRQEGYEEICVLLKI